MKISLVYPYNAGIPNNYLKMMGRIPHIGLLSIGGMLQKDGHTCDYVDAFNFKLSAFETIDRILRFGPEIIGITSNTPNYSAAIEVAKLVRKKTSCPIVIGGQHATNMPKEVLDTGLFDFVVIGEGDLTMSRIADAIQHKKNLDNIPGLAYYNGNNNFHRTKEEVIEDLNILPERAWNLVDLAKYRPSPASYRRTPAISTMGQRGCPQDCIYCSVNSVFKHNTRNHSIKFLENELKLFKSNNIRDIQFWDSVFTKDRNLAIDIAKLLRKYGFIWNCLGRINDMDEELLKIMHDCGCYCIGYGIESGVQKSLDLMGKMQELEQIKRIVNLTKKTGILVKGFYIIGFPWETKEEIMTTIAFAGQLKTEFVAFSIANPYPGSPWFNEYSHMFKKEADYEGIHNLSSKNAISEYISNEELQKIRDHAHFHYYVNIGYILAQLKHIKTWRDLIYYITNFVDIFIVK